MLHDAPKTELLWHGSMPCPEPEDPICLLHLGGAFVALGVLASAGKMVIETWGFWAFRGDRPKIFWLEFGWMFVGFCGLLH